MRERLIGRVLVKKLSRKATSTARNEIHGGSSLLLAFLFENVYLPMLTYLILQEEPSLKDCDRVV
jgi:hypothetical protein